MRRRLAVCAWLTLALGSTAGAQSARPGLGATPYADAAGTGVVFRVWAPNASSVTVPGSFNSWSTTANPLTRESGSDLWSADIPNARPGHEYKFFLNGSIWKRDPRGRKVVSSAGNSIVYDPQAFPWGGDTRLPVTGSDLVIYELHVGAFYDPTPGLGGPGKFADAITKLNYLTNLGINAIELMPVAEFPGDYGWGYNPADPYAVENAGYGGPDGLKEFIKAAHQRGLRVLLDTVHNHYGPSDLELWGFDSGATPGIYLYSAPGICCTPWGHRPNYSSEGVRSYIIDNFRMWLEEYHLDGFRWDAVGAMRHYDPGYVSIPEADSLISYINNVVIHAQHPGAFSIAEDDSGGLNFDGEWSRGAGDTLIHTMAASTDEARDMYALRDALSGSGFSRVLFSETHDLTGNLNGPGAQRLPTRIQPAAPAGYYARKRSMLAAAMIMTAPGVPMLFMGQEMLTTAQFADNAPLDWNRTLTYSNIVNFYRDLIRLRRNLDGVSPGLTGPNLTWHQVDNSAKLLAFHRWGAAPDDQVTAIFNCANTTLQNYVIQGFPADGEWHTSLNSDWKTYSADFGDAGSSMVTVSGGRAAITIAPYSALILTRGALPWLDSDGDGLLNGWEQKYFGSPTAADPKADDDGDGANNLQEQTAGTDPTSPDSVLAFTGVRLRDDCVELHWKGGEIARQVVLKSGKLEGAWVPVRTNFPPTPITNSITLPLSEGTQFFRIQAGAR